MAFLVLLVWTTVNAQSLKTFEVLNPKVQQGDVLIIRISSQWMPPATSNPTIFINGTQYKPNENGEVFIGISTDAKPGKYIVEFWSNGRRDGWDYEEIEIGEYEFPETKIRRKLVSVNTSRRTKEATEINQAYSRSNPSANYAVSKFVQPLDNIFVTDVFGRKRIFLNGESRHEGIDLKAPKGTPVKTLNSGVVLLAVKNFSLEGNLVIIDHGSSVLSLYLHLSRIYVKTGSQVKVGDIIGLSGATGSVTGPHLHCIVIANGVKVDPLRFIEITNKYLR